MSPINDISIELGNNNLNKTSPLKKKRSMNTIGRIYKNSLENMFTIGKINKNNLEKIGKINRNKNLDE